METDGFGPKGLSPSIVYRLSSIIYPSISRSYTTSGFAAVGILMTLSPKRASASTQGSFLGKELPTGLRLADEIWPAGPVLIYPSNSRTASHRLSDSIAAHRLSRPKPHPFPQAPRYTKSPQALPAIIPAESPWLFYFPSTPPIPKYSPTIPFRIFRISAISVHAPVEGAISSPG